MNTTPKDLLDAGVHFGHQTKRWNPRSKPFIFDHRQGISIIDLGKTHQLLEKSYTFLENLVANGGTVLFVATKKQAKDMVRETAIALNMPYCVDRWLGGTLTNFVTVKKSIAKFKRFQAMENNGELAKLSGKEGAAIKREMVRMQKNFAGIVEMPDLPSALFVIDTAHEKIAVAEAARSNIPCVGLVDTNADPSQLSHPIPGNDDAAKSIRIILDTITEAIQSGLAQRSSRRNQRGQADIQAAAATAAVAEAVGISTEPEAAAAGEEEKPKRKTTRKKAATKDEAAAEAPAAEAPATEEAA